MITQRDKMQHKHTQKKIHHRKHTKKLYYTYMLQNNHKCIPTTTNNIHVGYYQFYKSIEISAGHYNSK